MNNSIENLRRQIEGAEELGSVARTMKALAASNIGQYERAVTSLHDYYHTIELGISASLRQQNFVFPAIKKQMKQEIVHVIVFGSDQGLVGQFNDLLAEFVVKKLKELPGEKKIWTVGERTQSRLAEVGWISKKTYTVPNAVYAITSLITQILIENDIFEKKREDIPFYIFHNRPQTGTLYEPVVQRLLPLDTEWQNNFLALKWPGINLPEVIGDYTQTLWGLVHEYIFVSLFKACAESLTSENSSRMAAMQRAEKNIEELLDDLTQSFHRLRQNTIDEELFDIVSGFEALTRK
jgi:F-type H+-transporting ATPase subunit gamma